ncbi:hypothetical protein JP74_06885 [Devosia sp. 17-2-E-8]|nr:hypothetical protein JP74_06885 [Devosia sp. 17-2-E-8]
MTERYAIYYAPASNDPLWRLGCEWLGRDPAAGVIDHRPPGIEAAELDSLTVSARRYGFHATMKAPMILAPGTDRAELEQALADFTRNHTAFDVGQPVLRLIDGFLALVLDPQPHRLTDFAGTCVTVFERFRAPMAADDRASRVSKGLSERQVALLDQYGYPYVLEQFRFHMTLSDRLPEAWKAPLTDLATDWFAPILMKPLQIDRLALFHQPEAGAAFTRLADFPLPPAHEL